MSENNEKIQKIEDPYTLELSKPIKLADVSYETLTLTEPTAGQVEKATNTSNAVTSNIIMISEVAKVPETVVRRLSSRDFAKAVKYLENFISGGPETGGTYSPN